MIEDATVRLSNSSEVEADRVKFKNGGWLGVRADDGWIYYPPSAVDRVVSEGDSK